MPLQTASGSSAASHRPSSHNPAIGTATILLQTLNASPIAPNDPSTTDPGATSPPLASSPEASSGQYHTVPLTPVHHPVNHLTHATAGTSVQCHCANVSSSAYSSFRLLFAKTFVGNVIGTVGLILALGLELFSAIISYQDIEWSERADSVQACASLFSIGIVTPFCNRTIEEGIDDAPFTRRAFVNTSEPLEPSDSRPGSSVSVTIICTIITIVYAAILSPIAYRLSGQVLEASHVHYHSHRYQAGHLSGEWLGTDLAKLHPDLLSTTFARLMSYGAALLDDILESLRRRQKPPCSFEISLESLNHENNAMSYDAENPAHVQASAKAQQIASNGMTEEGQLRRRNAQPSNFQSAVGILKHAHATDMTDSESFTQLKRAYQSHDHSIIDFVQDTDDLGVSPLHLAVAYGYVEACQWLIECGADAKALTHDGRTISDFSEDAVVNAGDNFRLYFRILHCRKFVREKALVRRGKNNENGMQVSRKVSKSNRLKRSRWM